MAQLASFDSTMTNYAVLLGLLCLAGSGAFLNETQECGAGYTYVQQNCIDVNECLLKICHPWATCENTIGSYNCSCKPGFIGDGINCSPKIPCPEGWVTYPGSESCYKFSEEKLNWTSASEGCKETNASLICLDGKEKMGFFGARVNGGTWLGLNDLEQEGKYVCENGEEGLPDRPWGFYREANEPEETPQKNCVASVNRFFWGTTNCNDTKRSACKVTTSPCPSQWAEYPELPGQCFAANSNLLPFEEAKETCEKSYPGARMITMGSLYENEFLGTQSDTPRWLGLKKFPGETEWVSVSPEYENGFRNWLEEGKEQEKNEEDFDICAVLLQSLWFVQDCSNVNYFVCETPFQE